MTDPTRTDHFEDGAQRVREPQFFTRQQAPGGLWHPQKTSTLDQLLPSMNGMGNRDYTRMVMGVKNAPLGQSQSTFDRSLWMRNGQTTERYNNTID